jgi:dUTPase
MRELTIKKITKVYNQTYDITVENNHNFFCNGFLIHNCGYRDTIKVILHNAGYNDFEVKVGDRIAQIALAPVYKMVFKVVEEVSETDRGRNGIGSTGV